MNDWNDYWTDLTAIIKPSKQALLTGRWLDATREEKQCEAFMGQNAL
jgi:hypothetical protein